MGFDLVRRDTHEPPAHGHDPVHPADRYHSYTEPHGHASQHHEAPAHGHNYDHLMHEYGIDHHMLDQYGIDPAKAAKLAEQFGINSDGIPADALNKGSPVMMEQDGLGDLHQLIHEATTAYNKKQEDLAV